MMNVPMTSWSHPFPSCFLCLILFFPAVSIRPSVTEVKTDKQQPGSQDTLSGGEGHDFKISQREQNT